VVVLAGDTVTEDVVAPPGAHEYVPPPSEGLAVSDADAPMQMVEVAGVMLTVGCGLTVTVLVPVPEQPVNV